MNNPAIMAMTVLGGLLSATLSLLPLLLSHFVPALLLIFVSGFSTLPLFLLGLAIGLRPLYIACLIATALIFLLEGPFFALEFFAFSALGSSFLIYKALLKRKLSSGKFLWYPSSLIVKDLTFACSAVMILALGVYIYFARTGDVDIFINALLKPLEHQGHIRNAKTLLTQMVSLFPGFFAFSWGIMMLINASLAQGLLVRFGINLRPTPSLEELNAPKSFLILLGISLVLSIVGVGYLEFLGKNAVLVFILPFFLIGLGIVHKWFHKTSFAVPGLIIFYFILLLFFWLAFFVILLGLLKPLLEKPKTSN